MKVLLDTNFVVTCVRQKIDFISSIDQLVGERVELIVPKEVIAEITDISKRKGEKVADKEAAKLSLSILSEAKFDSPELLNKNVDQGILEYLRDKEILLATLDKKLRDKSLKTAIIIKKGKTLSILPYQA